MDPLTEESAVWELDEDTITLLAEKYRLTSDELNELLEELGL